MRKNSHTRRQQRAFGDWKRLRRELNWAEVMPYDNPVVRRLRREMNAIKAKYPRLHLPDAASAALWEGNLYG